MSEKKNYITGSFKALKPVYFDSVFRDAGYVVEISEAHEIETISEATYKRVGKVAKPSEDELSAAEKRGEEKAKKEAAAQAKAEKEAKEKADAKAEADKKKADAAAKA